MSKLAINTASVKVISCESVGQLNVWILTVVWRCCRQGNASRHARCLLKPFANVLYEA